ncbi:hypothetical protein QQF64_007530 [Cirrhinus molitorella]|uniref:Uncharacterized protein n=1 Tax=Cirrhinus molitorella TaxID=172907 RepID=A0ABR3MAY3_9TELE
MSKTRLKKSAHDRERNIQGKLRGEKAKGIRLNPRMKRVRCWFSAVRVRPALRAPRQALRECVGSDACAVFARTHTLMNERGSWGRGRRGG